MNINRGTENLEKSRMYQSTIEMKRKRGFICLSLVLFVGLTGGGYFLLSAESNSKRILEGFLMSDVESSTSCEITKGSKPIWLCAGEKGICRVTYGSFSLTCSGTSVEK